MIQGMDNSFWGAKGLGYKLNGTKRYLEPNDRVGAIEKKLAGGLSVKDLSEEEYKMLNAHERAETAAFNAHVTEIFSKAEKIAIKIAKGEKLTPEEEQLMNEKFPDLKREAEQAKKEGEDLKERIKVAKTREEKQQIASGAMQSISSQMSKGTMAPIQAAIKVVVIQKAIEEAEKEDEENKGLTRNAMKQLSLEPGSLLNIRG